MLLEAPVLLGAKEQLRSRGLLDLPLRQVARLALTRAVSRVPRPALDRALAFLAGARRPPVRLCRQRLLRKAVSCRRLPILCCRPPCRYSFSPVACAAR